MKKELPFVSALLVTRNEQDYIDRAVKSLINQTYKKNRYEIIIVDGHSTDSTVRKVNSIISEYKDTHLNIRLIYNEKHILASGWNLGIKNANGDYVVRIDAHAEATPDFIEKNVYTMQNCDAVCVGGKLITKSLSGDDNIISKVLSSPFGVGNSTFRVSNTAGYADTAVYGLYKKDIFESVGYFDERYVRNQDIELHSRIKKNGGKFFFNPEIVSTYYTRNTFKKIMRQAYGNGKWNMVLLKNGSSALSIRHLVPFAFVLFLIASIIMGFFCKTVWTFAAGVVLLHICLGLIAAYKKTDSFIELVEMPLLFLLLHLSYGIGYLSGIFVRLR